MRAVTALRVTGAWWVLPLIFLGTSVLGSSVTPFLSGYPASDLASTSLALGLVAPVAGAFVAHAFRGFPKFMRSQPAVRSGLRVVLRQWWPLLLGIPAAACLGLLVAARAVPDDASSWSLLLLAFLTLLGFASMGLLASWGLPVVISVPLVAAVGFGWLSWIPSTDNVWLHGWGEEAIVRAVTSGIDNRMPAQNQLLNADQIHVLTAYVWGLSNKPAKP